MIIIILCFILFFIITIYQLRLANSNVVTLELPHNKGTYMSCNGWEALLIFMFATAWIGIIPLLSTRLAFLEIFSIWGLSRYTNVKIKSLPLTAYAIFLGWIIIGIFYSPSLQFGVRMLLKYLYPFMAALLCAKVVRNGELSMTIGTWCRLVGTIVMTIWITRPLAGILGLFLWSKPACVTGMITLIVMSFSFSEFTNEKKKNLIWGLALCLPCVLLVYRTDIFGTAVALSAFYIIKYRAKAIPIVAAIGIAVICMMFFIPSMREKMFQDKDITLTEVIDGKVKLDERSVNTNLRSFMWKDAKKRFYKDHELTGRGTGRVQKFMYTEVNDVRRGTQLHNDFLVIKCDNGDIGLALLIITYLCVFLHCLKMYRNSPSPYARMWALTAGSAILGVAATMYSDNTISYSMVTLSIPWGFYGMALGLDAEAKEHPEESDIRSDSPIHT